MILGVEIFDSLEVEKGVSDLLVESVVLVVHHNEYLVSPVLNHHRHKQVAPHKCHHNKREVERVVAEEDTDRQPDIQENRRELKQQNADHHAECLSSSRDNSEDFSSLPMKMEGE